MIGYSPLPTWQSGGITGTLKAHSWGRGGFDPLSISSMTEWFDYRTLASVGDGNPIGSWAGNKGLYTLAQSGTVRPTYVTDDGDGRAAAQFDMVNDCMSTSMNGTALYGSTGNFEVWAQVKGQSAGASSNTWWSSFGTGQNFNLFAQKPYPRLFVYAGSGSNYGWSNTTDIQDDAWHTVRVQFSGGVLSFYVDGSQVTTAFFNGQFAWSPGSATAYMGWDNASQYWGGSFRHMLFFNAHLDDATAAKLTTYLQTA